MREPTASRPQMPGYGIREDAEGLLPWPWAEERLAACRNFWVATTRPDARPHAMPVWAVWLDGVLWFSTAITSVKARNLRANPNVVVATEGAAEAVILEGAAQLVADHAALKPAWDAYKAKYNWDLAGESMFALRPAVAFAFIEAADSFAQTATRWRFA